MEVEQNTIGGNLLTGKLPSNIIHVLIERILRGKIEVINSAIFTVKNG